MATIREIVIIIGAVVGVMGTAIPLVINLIRKTKAWVRERDWNRVMGELPRLIIEAERFLNYTGDEKKEYVKSRLAVFAVGNRIVFDEAKFDASIDNVVRLTKMVNMREKDKVALLVDEAKSGKNSINNSNMQAQESESVGNNGNHLTNDMVYRTSY